MSLLTVARRQLAKRAPKLEDAARQRRWRAENRSRALDVRPTLDAEQQRVATELVEKGIVVTDFGSLFGSTKLFDAARGEAERMYREHREHPPVQDDGNVKPFLTQLFTGPIATDDVWGRIALHPSVLAIANEYLGMRGMLRAAQVWLTEPTPGPATETQLWHRDGDDVMNVKLFIYFTDVGRGAGPFTYAPRTHPRGTVRRLPEHVRTRSTDEQMSAVVPAEDWVVCTGPAGTVVFADTCGFHKQLKPESHERLLLTIQYTSGTPAYPRNLEIHGDTSALDTEQRFAVLQQP
jgi:hypothetical protein